MIIFTHVDIKNLPQSMSPTVDNLMLMEFLTRYDFHNYLITKIMNLIFLIEE